MVPSRKEFHFRSLGLIAGCPLSGADNEMYCAGYHLDDILDSKRTEVDAIIFFPGDVQHLKRVMTANHHGERCWDRYCLEESTQRLADLYYPDSPLVIVVRPAHTHQGGVACYANFVGCDPIQGIPKYESESAESLEHLATLFDNCGVGKHIRNMTLVGFSKGLTCGRQSTRIADSRLTRLVKSTTEFVFLDGGHNGDSSSSPVWLTDQSVLSLFAQSNIKVDIHVTPYQINCPRRPWIASQLDTFRNGLQDLAEVKVHSHFAHEPPSLTNHFRLLDDL